jgi:hypothetical protein
VVFASAWPIHSWIARSGAPAAALCVPNVCRSSWKVIACTPASEGVLEALAHLGGVEHVPGFGVAQDEVTVASVARALVQGFELAGEPRGHRDRAAFVGLGSVHPPAREVVRDANAPDLPVDVQPLQRQQLALA